MNNDFCRKSILKGMTVLVLFDQHEKYFNQLEICKF